ncbi:protein kinase domain-containing protein [Hyalangium minutum]|uniref:Protein kinase domain-containing protein n=1 Tax=Hyalangium minutum TaxID=394096 RepID=A0A085WHG8_9BACT|nr:hypothetical protein [Hyalangium minutum]KFE67131.1 hypothetical protein DB31_8484 [Hyalangium minutum]
MHFDAPDVGSTVGPWLLQEHVDSGSFGIVYLARRAEQPDSPRTHRELLQVLAQLAGALATAHARGALHRDVKGENIRVRTDGRAVLLDWGSGWFEGASPLTDSPAPPGTTAYRPPEQRAFQWQFRKDMEARWHSTATDDLYSLGVTLYRLVTGKYLPPCTDGGEPVARKVPPPSTLATVSPELETIILRLISDDRKVRGTAEQLARESAMIVETGGPALDLAIRPTSSALVTEEGEPPQPSSGGLDDDGLEEDERPSDSVPAKQKNRAEVAPSMRDRVRQHHELAVPAWLTWTGASAMGGLITALMMLWVRPGVPEPAPKPLPNPTPWLATPEEVAPFAPDAGVGEAALSSVENMNPRVGDFVVSLGRSMPSKPFPLQRRPPCNRGEKEINGGCWIGPIDAEKPPCGDQMFDYEGRCYFASFGENRQPTSGEP